MKSRTLFWILAVINLLLAGAVAWSILQPEKPLSVPDEEHVAQVHLLSELPEASLAEAKPAVASEPIASPVEASAPSASAAISMASATIASAEVAPAKPVLSCLMWADLSGRQWIEARLLLQKKLGRLDFEERMNEDKAKFWVYIPPADNLDAARSTLAGLKEKGITDALVIQDNSAQHLAVSLGLFSKKAMADQFIAQLKAKDVTGAIIKPHPQSRYISVLMRALTEEQLSEIKKLASSFEKTSMRPVKCATE